MSDSIALPAVAQRPVTTADRLRTLAMIVVLLLAFGLRLYHLDYQSLEGDEGISLQRSSQPFGQMMERMPVEHVPGYFILLFGWLRLGGDEDFALRYLSVLPSVLAVALVYRWAASMGRPTTGLIAALLLATNSFQIWYAQQARMYGWLLATSLLSFWALWRIVSEMRQGDERRKATRRWWLSDLIYIIATTATVYLHYFGFLMPIAQTLFMAIWQIRTRPWRDSWRITQRWAIDGAIIFILFLPWLRNAIAFLSFQGWRPPLDPGQVPWTMHAAYTVGFPMPEPWQTWLPWLYLLLAVFGLIVWWRQNRMAWLLLTTAIFVPFILIFIAVLRNPDFHERYSMFLSGPWLILIAAGFGIAAPLGSETAGSRRKWNAGTIVGVSLAALLVVGLAGLNWLALKRLYFDASIQKADYRGAAQRIYNHEAPGDVVLVDGPNPELVFDHYYRWYDHGQAPVYDLRSLADKKYDEVAKTLQEQTGKAPHAWEVLYFHSPGPVQFWLATNGWSSAPSDHNGIRVTLYGLEGGPALVEQTVGTAFGNGLTLQKAEVDGPSVAPGDLVRVTTHWRVDAPLPEYKFSLRLATPDGQIVMADDYEPQNWFTPTSKWGVGEIADQRALILPADLAAGQYVVMLRLYDPSNGVAVDTPAGQDVVLGKIEVK